jgi:hypothetical protein
MDLLAKYLTLLKLELQDLAEDIGMLVSEYKIRKEKGEITNYVLLENLAVLRNELIGIESIGEMLDGIEPGGFSSLEALVESVEEKIAGRIMGTGYNNALLPLVKRKLAKVATYVRHVG